MKHSDKQKLVVAEPCATPVSMVSFCLLLEKCKEILYGHYFNILAVVSGTDTHLLKEKKKKKKEVKKNSEKWYLKLTVFCFLNCCKQTILFGGTLENALFGLCA